MVETPVPKSVTSNLNGANFTSAVVRKLLEHYSLPPCLSSSAGMSQLYLAAESNSAIKDTLTPLARTFYVQLTGAVEPSLTRLVNTLKTSMLLAHQKNATYRRIAEG